MSVEEYDSKVIANDDLYIQLFTRHKSKMGRKPIMD